MNWYIPGSYLPRSCFAICPLHESGQGMDKVWTRYGQSTDKALKWPYPFGFYVIVKRSESSYLLMLFSFIHKLSMRIIPSLLLLFAQDLSAQWKSVTYSNYGELTTIGNYSFRSSKIHEITLNPDKTFELWSRPHISCATWREYKGTWKQKKDSVIFSDHYEVIEADAEVTYQRDITGYFYLNFKTDRSSALKNREIKLEYIYDFDAHIDNIERSLRLDTDSSMIIPYSFIPHLSKLAAIKIEYQLTPLEKRYAYLTENKTLNMKEKEIPNIINVVFVEKPKKEIVYRTIKAVVRESKLTIISSSKTKTTLPDYYRDIEFEDGYTLTK
jgi:hypothetical protein